MAKKRTQPVVEVSEFDVTHFPTPPMVKQFYDHLISRTIVPSFHIDLDSMNQLKICDSTLREQLEHVRWCSLLTLEENVYPNLIKVFYSNMDISASHQDRILTNVYGVPIEFDVRDLNMIIWTKNESLKLYTSRMKLQFSNFIRVKGVKNIYKRVDLSDDVCTLSLRS